MRFLADMGVATSTVRARVAAGHDAVHLSAQGLQRLADDQILVKARDEKRIVITFDLDFGDLLGARPARFSKRGDIPAARRDTCISRSQTEPGHRGAGSRA